MNYIFDTHYGKSSLADPETGLVIEWENGRFNETQNCHVEKDYSSMDAGELASLMARTAREMTDYIIENYKELI